MSKLGLSSPSCAVRGKVGPQVHQNWQPRMQHPGHRWVDPFHARTGASRSVGRTVDKLGAHWPRITKGLQRQPQCRPGLRGKLAHASGPFHWPTPGLHQLAGQAKRQIKCTHPRAGLQLLLPRIQAAAMHHFLQQHHATRQTSKGQNNLFFGCGAAGKIAPQQTGLVGPWPSQTAHRQALFKMGGRCHSAHRHRPHRQAPS